jgi:uncharacterized protein YcbK (DUF882 family)
MSRIEQLSPHFRVAEFASRGTRPPAAYVHWAQRLCVQYLEPLRAEFGPVTVFSGYRSAAHNHDVGGAPNSYHQSIPGRRGAAADVGCRRGTPHDWYRFLDGLGIPGLGIYPGHVHADNRPGRARW